MNVVKTIRLVKLKGRATSGRPFTVADSATNLEGVPDAKVRLAREPAAASQIRQHEKGVGTPAVLRCISWIIEVRAVAAPTTAPA